MKLEIVGRLVFAGLLGAIAPAWACDVCAIYTATSQRTEQTGVHFGAAEQYTHYRTLQQGSHEVANPARQHLESSITQLFVGYNFTHRLGAQLTLPIIARVFRRPEGGQIQTGNETGFGDLSLTGHVVAYDFATERSVFRFTLLGGIKFPTGNPDRIGEELQEDEAPAAGDTASVESGIHGHDLALGSGSFDGIVGGGLFWSHDRFFATAAAQYAIRSRGAFDYQYANELTWNGGPGYFVLLDHAYTLRLQGVLSGETKGNDNLAGVQANDTAVTALYVGPGCTYTWGTRLAAEFAVDLPVVQHNTSLQLIPDVRVRGGVTWSF